VSTHISSIALRKGTGSSQAVVAQLSSTADTFFVQCYAAYLLLLVQELEALPVLDDANLTESLRTVTMEDFQV
jgi:hypothetical protein